MKICLCVDRWPTWFPVHGPVRYVQTLARELARQGHQVHVLTPHPGLTADHVEEGYHVHARQVKPLRGVSRLQAGLGESYGLWSALKELHRKEALDVVEFSNWEGVGAVSVTLGRLPTVIRLYTSAFDSLRLQVGHLWLERQYARLERWTARRARGLVTHSASHRSQIASDYGVPKEQIHLIPLGVEPLPASRSLGAKIPRVVTVGAATPRKGVDLFLEIASRVLPAHPEASFLWIGKDTATAPGKRTWQQFCNEEYPHLKNVQFLTDCPDAELGALYAESAIYLCTSQYESFGLTLVEAMHAKLPVVTPNMASMPELVQEGVNGHLFPPGNSEKAAAAVLSLLRNPAQATQLGGAGFALARTEYSVEQMTHRALELYRDVCRV